MPQLGRLYLVFQDTSGNARVGSSISIYREGATVNGVQSGTSPLAVLVRHAGKIATGDTVFINGLTGTTYSATRTSSTVITLSGFAGTLVLANGDRLVPSNTQPTIYSDDQGGATVSQPLLSGSNGTVSYWMYPGAYEHTETPVGSLTTTLYQSIVAPTEVLAGVRYADQFHGADSGAQIANAILDLPSTGGTVDARGFVGTQDWASNPFASAPNETLVLLGAATFRAAAQVVIPTKVIVRGIGRGGTIIQANGIAPATGLVKLGAGGVLAFGCRVENMRVDCNSVASSIGIYSTDINEQSGANHVLVTGYMNKGIQIAESGAQVPDHFLFDDVEVSAAATATGTYGFHIDYSRNGGQLRRVTANSDNTGTTQTAGVYVHGTVAGGGSVHIFGVNCERHDDGVFFDTNGSGTVINVSLFTSGTSCVRINTSHPVAVINALRSAGTNLIRNDRLGQNMTLLRTGFYFAGFDTAGNQAFAMGGSTANSGNIISDVHPVFQIRSMGTAADASRVSSDMVNGNGAGWRVNFEGNDGRLPISFRPIVSNSPTTDVIRIDNTGGFYITDGITAPGTLAGFGVIYIDTADGDLKIKFGDGVVKTIVVDT